MEKVICSQCGKECIGDGVGTGYGKNRKGEKFCYECCGKNDLAELENLKIGERVCQYLHIENQIKGCKYRGGYCNSHWGESYEIRNWPGTLKIKAYGNIGYHNMAYVQRNVWFNIGDKKYHGVQYGNDSEICYIKRIKG